MKANKSYWSSRYLKNNTPWDTGDITAPIKTYFDQIENKNLKILIPGCGYGHEASYLWSQGFKNIYILDIAEIPIKEFANKNKKFPREQLLLGDFFILKGQYDIIIEQTFFCALSPNLRENYRNKMFELLKPKGKLIGLFFSFKLDNNGPPYGGSIEEYQNLFYSHFNIKVLDRCKNSIKPRKDKELFFIFERKTKCSLKYD